MTNNPKVIITALKYIGINEIVSGSVNPLLHTFAKEIGAGEQTVNYPWCSGFLNYILKLTGYRYCPSLHARDNLNQPKLTTLPELGDIAVFWTGMRDAHTGHVGFFICESDQYYHVLGGNQGDTVCIARMPKYQLLGFRRPVIGTNPVKIL